MNTTFSPVRLPSMNLNSIRFLPLGHIPHILLAAFNINHIRLTEEAQVAKLKQLGKMSQKTWACKTSSITYSNTRMKNIPPATLSPSETSSLRVHDQVDHLNKKEGSR